MQQGVHQGGTSGGETMGGAFMLMQLIIVGARMRTMSRPVPGAMGGAMRALVGLSAAAIDSMPAEPRATATARPT